MTVFQRLLVVAFALALTACASSGPRRVVTDNYISPNFQQPPAKSLIVLLPADVEAEDMRPGVASMLNALNQKLSAAGYKVVALDQASHDVIWQQEVQDVGGVYDPNTGAVRELAMMNAVGHLVQRVSSETGAGMVILPRFVLRRAEIAGMSAVWDGQQRRVPTFGTAGDTLTQSGSTLGLSVSLQMIATSGELLMNTYGGALLPYRVNARTAKNEVRADLFADEAEVAEGVAIALAPFFRKR